MMPGVDHCFGGEGPDFVNYLDIIDAWVETGKAPDQLTSLWLNDQFLPVGSRPVCAHPKYVKYSGTGGPRGASSFSCVGYRSAIRSEHKLRDPIVIHYKGLKLCLSKSYCE
jgi:hypothetical protein